VDLLWCKKEEEEKMNFNLPSPISTISQRPLPRYLVLTLAYALEYVREVYQ
jgi:hypothetical protein